MGTRKDADGHLQALQLLGNQVHALLAGMVGIEQIASDEQEIDIVINDLVDHSLEGLADLSSLITPSQRAQGFEGSIKVYIGRMQNPDHCDPPGAPLKGCFNLCHRLAADDAAPSRA